MRFVKIFFIGLFLLIPSLSYAQDTPTATPSSNSSQYTLGPDDTIEIIVTDHPLFTGVFSVNSEGKIQYNSIGEVDVGGLAQEQLEEKIRKIVSKYAPDAEVRVIIRELNSKEFYVLGEVANPGKYYMYSQGISVKDAVEMAGLPTNKAELSHAEILTRAPEGNTARKVNLYSLLKEGNLKENLILKAGESLFIPAKAESSQEIGTVTGEETKPETNLNNSDSLKYTLGPEDIIEIKVANHPEFSGVYTINVEGKFQYSLAGDIDAINLTPGQLKDKIKRIISVYVVAPEVIVSIVEYKSKVFFVLGEIAKPGQYHMHSETISVKDAVIMAGLPTPAAAIRKARIITPGFNGSKIKEVNLYNLFYLGDLRENFLLKPGDSLFVPTSVAESVGTKKVIGSNFNPLKYTLGPEDVVEINVINHSDFSGIYSVNPEGKIQYKFVGDIDVTGLTRGELQEKIKKIISPYVVSPEVNVTITEFKSKIFYVLGDVRRPGKYHMNSEAISVKEAVIMAGLPSKTAALNKARIITPGLNGGSVKEVNLNALLYNGDLRQNVMLKPGDSLYVPTVTRRFAETMKPSGSFDPLRYTLGPDDVITISVMDRPDFSGTFPVSMEGKIQYKFVGDINVIGMTKFQLEEKLKKVLASYVVSPEVNVTITEFKSKAFYVLGEVGTPGKYYMRADNISVSEAVIMAGLPTLTAAMRKTQIITPSRNGAIARKVNLYTLLYSGDLKENLLLKPGDYLYVPSTVLAKVIRIVSPVSTTIGLAAGPAIDAADAKGIAATVK